MRSHQFITENTQQYDPSKKYYGSIPEIKYLPLSVIKRRELDFRPEVMTVSDEVAKNMDYSEPILVSVYRFDDQDDDITPEVTLDDGHHRMAAALQTGRKYLPVVARAVNAKGEKIISLIQLSKQIEDGAARSATPQVSEEAEHDYKANAIFLARSNSCPKMWSYDHVGFLLPNGQQVQMSGHKQSNGVYVTNKVTDDPAFPEQQIKTMKLKKTIIVPSTNTVNAENCGTFVSNVLKQNGIVMTLQSLYALFKQPRPHVTEAEGEPEGLKHISKELLQHIVKQVGTEGAHAIVKSLEWGDGAAKELLQLIVKDLKRNIRVAESTKQRLDPKCWKGKHKEGTKIKGGIRVNNCVPNKKVNEDSTADLESEFVAAYSDDPMGVFRNVKDNFLHLISQLKPINHWAAALNKKINTMSKDDFAQLVMNEIFPRLKAANWPKPWGEEMANVFLDYKTEKLQNSIT